MPDHSLVPSPSKGRILIIDDEADIRESLETLLGLEGFTVATAPNADAGEAALALEAFDLVLLDLMMPGRSGMELLQELRGRGFTTPIFMLTAYGSVEVAVQALKSGANDYFAKPWDNSKLLIEIERMIAKEQLEQENARLRRALRERFSFSNLIGKSDRMLKLVDLLEQVAPARTPVLLAGETGTGKEFIAKAIHANSPRRDQPFVMVVASALGAEMADQALFGSAGTPGQLEAAQGGTVFIDEVAVLSLDCQARLLRAVQEREVRRPATGTTVPLDVRLIAASTQDLRRAMEEHRFRDDLFYRLSTFMVPVPALRERKEDIPLLLDHFINRHARENSKYLDDTGRSLLQFDNDALRLMVEHSWPGNVEELDNVVERAVVLASSEVMSADLLPEYLLHAGGVWTRPEAGSDLPPDASLHERVNDFERRLISEALERYHGSQTDTAEALRVPLSTLNQKIKRLNIEVKRR